MVTLITPKFDFCPVCICGTSSSIITYIIAPAAKDSKYGNNGTTMPINATVRPALIGSTIPDSTPYKNAFGLLSPCIFSGIEIIAPSGIF